MSLAAARHSALGQQQVASLKLDREEHQRVCKEQREKIRVLKNGLGKFPFPTGAEYSEYATKLETVETRLESGEPFEPGPFNDFVLGAREIIGEIFNFLSVLEIHAVGEAFFFSLTKDEKGLLKPLYAEIKRKMYEKHIGHLVALFDVSGDILDEEKAKEYVLENIEEFNLFDEEYATKQCNVFTACAICNVANARIRFNHFYEYLEEHAARIKLHDDFNSPRAIEEVFYKDIDKKELNLPRILEMLKRCIPYDVTPVEFFRFCKVLVKATCSDQWSTGDEASRDRVKINVEPSVYEEIEGYGVTAPQEYCVELHFQNLQNGRGTACMRFRLMLPTQNEGTMRGGLHPGVCISYGVGATPGDFRYDLRSRTGVSVPVGAALSKKQQRKKDLYGRGGRRTDIFIGTIDWRHTLKFKKDAEGNWQKLPSVQLKQKNFNVLQRIRTVLDELRRGPGVRFFTETIRGICERWRKNGRLKRVDYVKTVGKQVIGKDILFTAVYLNIIGPWLHGSTDGTVEAVHLVYQTYQPVFDLVLQYCTNETDIEKFTKQLYIEMKVSRTDSLFDSLIDLSTIPTTRVHAQGQLFEEHTNFWFTDSYGMRHPQTMPAGHFFDSFARMCVDFGYPFYPASKVPVDRLNPPPATNYKVAAPFIDRTLQCSGITNA